MLGEGSFGSVCLAKHKLSQTSVAIKIIEKARIDETFTKHGEKFSEEDIMRDCCETKSVNVLQFIEGF